MVGDAGPFLLSRMVHPRAPFSNIWRRQLDRLINLRWAVSGCERVVDIPYGDSASTETPPEVIPASSPHPPSALEPARQFGRPQSRSTVTLFADIDASISSVSVAARVI
jgi:hypothetical protein